MLAIIAALAAGIGIDWAAGDPPNRYHPVAWLGKSIEWIIPHAKGHNEKARGILLACAAVASAAIAAHLVTLASVALVGTIGLIVTSALLLKIVVAIKGMEKHAMTIMLCIGNRDVLGARRSLSLIV